MRGGAGNYVIVVKEGKKDSGMEDPKVWELKLEKWEEQEKGSIWRRRKERGRASNKIEEGFGSEKS